MEDWSFVINIVAALVMGMAIGLERQIRQHPAGLRTNTLVCVGAALFVSVSRMAENAAPTRVAAQVVSGIGFLGGGVILREGLNVRGLATAATMWCSAAVGTLAGMGYLIHGAVGTASILFIHLALRPLVRVIDANMKGRADFETQYQFRVVCPTDQVGVIRNIFMRHVNAQPHMSVQGISTEETEQSHRSVVVVDILSIERNDKYMNDLVSRISVEPSVSAVSWDKAR